MTMSSRILFLIFVLTKIHRDYSFSTNRPFKVPTTRFLGLSATTMYLEHEELDEKQTDSFDPDCTLEERQKWAAAIATSFQPNEFKPVPLFRNKHVQTIASAFLRDVPECRYVASNDSLLATISAAFQRLMSPRYPATSFWDKRERIETPDGDWFHVDYKYANETSKGLVIVLHGLEANSESMLTIDIGQAYHEIGMDVACINFRGCTGVPNNKPGSYHLGFTDDLILFLKLVQSRYDQGDIPPIYLSGYSLGGNVVMNALGELGIEAKNEYNIHGASLLCVPIDCERNAPFFGSPGFNQLVYCENLLQTMRQKGNTQLEQFCDGDVDTTLFDYKGVLEAKTVSEFDAAFVAPLYGFEDEIDYYRNVSSIYHMDNVAVPTMMLNARDDPFMDPSHFPVEKSREFGGKAPIKMVLSNHGGHIGFTFHQTSDEDKDGNRPSWASTELARFVHHVHTHLMMQATELEASDPTFE